MGKLEELKEGEAEIFVRTGKEVLTVKLPPAMVKKLQDFQAEFGADDILEVIVRSAETMLTSMQSLKPGQHSAKKEGEDIRVNKAIGEENAQPSPSEKG